MLFSKIPLQEFCDLAAAAEVIRDFTNPSLPSEQRGRSSQHGYGDGGGPYALPPGARSVAFSHMGNAAAVAAAFGGGLPPGITGTNIGCTIIVSNLDPEQLYVGPSGWKEILQFSVVAHVSDTIVSNAIILVASWFSAANPNRKKARKMRTVEDADARQLLHGQPTTNAREGNSTSNPVMVSSGYRRLHFHLDKYYCFQLLL